jgi:hypothetical protein
LRFIDIPTERIGVRIRALAAGTAVLAMAVIATGAGVAAASSPASAARAVSTGPRSASAAKTRAAKQATAKAAAAASPDVRVRAGICTAPPAYRALAAKLSADIQGALRGRSGDPGVTVYDAVTGVSCYTNAAQHMDSASIVKTIILATLLRWHQETGKPLSSWEKDEATLMITQSDNDAATALWDEVGLTRLQDFLDAAKMNETQLGQDGYWGLTQVTAHDEMLLLELLARPSSVLTNSSRSYELGLMSQVISSQRWGTPDGAPSGVTVHVKNGWLGDASGWHVNSLGVFTGKDKNYMMAVLTTGDPTEQYGIDTIEGVARLVHRDLNEASLTAAAA